jgi:hypothetical protein
LLRVSRRPAGVIERVTIAVGGPAPGPDLAAIDDLAAQLADTRSATVRTMLVALRPGRPDGTLEPQFTGHPLPYGILFGPEAVTVHGTAHALAAPAATVRLHGPPGRPCCWCTVSGSTAALDAVLTHFAG